MDVPRARNALVATLACLCVGAVACGADRSTAIDAPVSSASAPSTTVPASTTTVSTATSVPSPLMAAGFDDLGGGWVRYGPGPLAIEAGTNGVGREGDTTVWTGAELVVWGGGVDGGRSYDDGAALDPESGAWREIAPPPIRPRDGHVAVWTGKEMIVWGGVDRLDEAKLDDGAAWDPVTDRWRRLADGPLSGGRGYAAAWTGDEVVVWGEPADPSTLTGEERRPATPRTGVAAYDPAADRWRRLPDPPVPLSFGELHWSGEELLLVGGQAFNSAAFTNRRGDVVVSAWQPSTGEWELFPPSGISAQSATAAWWADDSLVVVTYYPSLDGTRVWRRSTGEWSDGPTFPESGCEGRPALVDAAGVLVGSICGTVAVLDRTGSQWKGVVPLARSPEPLLISPVAAGDRVLFPQVDGSWVGFRPM